MLYGVFVEMLVVGFGAMKVPHGPLGCLSIKLTGGEHVGNPVDCKVPACRPAAGL